MESGLGIDSVEVGERQGIAHDAFRRLCFRLLHEVFPVELGYSRTQQVLMRVRRDTWGASARLQPETLLIDLLDSRDVLNGVDERHP